MSMATVASELFSGGESKGYSPEGAGGGDAETQPLLRITGRSSRQLGRHLPQVFRAVGAGICLAMIVASWVTMAQFLQDVGSTYKKPFFQAFFIHSFYSLIYVGWKVWVVFPGKFGCNSAGEGKLTNFKSIAVSSGILALIAYVSGTFWYLSLPRTSVSANTAIYQSASAIVFILSVPILRERVSVLKVVSIMLTITGVTLISVFSEDSNNENSTNTTMSTTLHDTAVITQAEEVENTPLGYVYLAISTVTYALMEVLFKKLCTKPDDPATVMNSVRVLGYFGVHTVLWMWPLLVILHFTGAETFEFPSLDIFKSLLINVCLDLIFNISLFMCIALSSPLVATVGSVLAIPASVGVDGVRNGYILPWKAILGIVGILIGFFALIFSESIEHLYWNRNHEKSTLETVPKGSTTQATKHSITSPRRGVLYYII